MQNDTLYNKIMNIEFEVFFDVDDPPYIKKATVKPSYFITNDMLDPNTSNLIFIQTCRIDIDPGFYARCIGGIMLEYNNINTEIDAVYIYGDGNCPFQIIGDLSTDEWSLDLF